MAINVDFYSFAKKHNSTAVPSSAPLTFACELKEGCSIIYPIVGLSNGSAWNPATYNYARIAAFNRYYYVTDWSYEGGLWWATLNVDVLASWKTAIYNTTEYVERAAKTFDGAIIDAMYPAKMTYTRSYCGWNGLVLLGSPWAETLENGVYIVGIINNDDVAVGAVSYYAFTPAQFSNFKSYLLGSLDWTGATLQPMDVSENLFKAMFDPFQYIVSINWFPFSYTLISSLTLQTDIKIGWWEIENIDHYIFSVPFVDFTKQLAIHTHPLASTRGKYLNISPYTTYILHAPPFGVFELNTKIIADANFNSDGWANILVNIRVDLISGKAMLSVNVTPAGPRTSIIILDIEAVLSIQIQLAQIYSQNNETTLVNTASNAVASLLGVITSGNIVRQVTGKERNVKSMYGSNVVDAATIGTLVMTQTGQTGSLSQFFLPFYVEWIASDMTDDAREDRGRPLYQEVQLSTLAPGFVLTTNSHVAIPGTDVEISEINDALDGGVFLE